MSSSETVLGRFVRRVETHYPLSEFSRRAWSALLVSETKKLAAEFDCSTLAAEMATSSNWCGSFVRAVHGRGLGAARISDATPASLATLDPQVVTGLLYGFGLPEMLKPELGSESAARYWPRTLIRAIAIRCAAQRLEQVDNNGLFAAAMVADVGGLVLLRELKQTYQQFIDDAEKHGHDLYQMELESLGFDQRVLAARLLDRWPIAEMVVRIVGEASGVEVDIPMVTQSQPLTSDDWRRFVFQASDLLSELLVGRLSVKRNQGRMTRLIRIARQIFRWELVDLQSWAEEVVEPARHLAECFEVEFGQTPSPAVRFDEAWNSQVQGEQQKTPVLAASSVSAKSPDPLAVAKAVASNSASWAPLSGVMGGPKPVSPAIVTSSMSGARESSDWMGGLGSSLGANERSSVGPLSRQETTNRSATAVLPEPVSAWLSDHLLNGQVQSLIEICRSRRQSLSLKLAQIDQFESLLFGGSMDEVYRIQQSLLTGFEQMVSGEGGRVIELGDDKFGFLLPGLDRTAANRLGQEVLRAIRQWSGNRQQTGKIGLTMSLGCASSDVPARNLKAAALIEAAARCLENVQRSAGNGLKSIDIYY